MRPLLATLCLLECAFGTEVVTLTPLRVVDVKAVTLRDVGKSGEKIDVLISAHGMWAALIRGTEAGTIVVIGDETKERAFAVPGDYDTAMLAGNGRLHLRRVPPRGAWMSPSLQRVPDPEVMVIDHQAREVERFKLPSWSLEPANVDGSWEWAALPRLPRHDSESAGWLRDGAAWYLENFSEILTVISPFRAESRNKLQMDEAFRAIGVSARPADRETGRIRFLWLTASSEGGFCVALSEVPRWGPAFIAEFEPLTGKLIRVMRAVLPTRPDLASFPHNPQGNIYPRIGAVSNNLLVADHMRQLVGIYPNPQK